MFEDIRDKRVLITGASSGLGAGMARAFAGLGARVGVHYGRNRAGADRTLEAVGAQGTLFSADLRSDEDLAGLWTQVEAAWGGIDVLINNAGVVLKGSCLGVDGDLWDETMAVNLRAPYLLSREAARRWIEAGTGGCILHNTSIHGTRSVEYFGGYAATKAALDRLTEVQALEWAPYGIRVNAVAPGVVPVERTATILAETAETWLPSIPLGRYGTPEDIAAVAVFLCSEAASWITGQTMVCDGGMLARMSMPRRPEPTPGTSGTQPQ